MWSRLKLLVGSLRNTKRAKAKKKNRVGLIQFFFNRPLKYTRHTKVSQAVEKFSKNQKKKSKHTHTKATISYWSFE